MRRRASGPRSTRRSKASARAARCVCSRLEIRLRLAAHSMTRSPPTGRHGGRSRSTPSIPPTYRGCRWKVCGSFRRACPRMTRPLSIGRGPIWLPGAGFTREDSPLWQSRVLGTFPEQSEDSLISLKWLEAARRPKVLPNDEAKLYAGIDVAEAGGDETVCAVRTRSGRIVAMQSWHGNSRGPVLAFLRTFQDRLAEINFDCAGVGAYFATDFESFGFININGINVGEATDFPDRYRNLKAQLYWSLRERFQNGEVSGLDDDVSVTQLASIRYEINPRGQVQIESKDEARKRGVKSPDRAETLMLAFADRTPGIIRYYEELSEARAARERDPSLPEPEPDTELQDIYDAETRRLRNGR